MTNERPTTWLEGDAAWMAQHLDAMRRSYQDELRRNVLGLLELRDLIDRVQQAAAVLPVPVEWADCVQAMEQKLGGLLGSCGVEELSTEGRVDPDVHHVIGVAETPGPAEAIARVTLRGYLWNGELLRAAEVVAFGPTGSEG